MLRTGSLGPPRAPLGISGGPSRPPFNSACPAAACPRAAPHRRPSQRDWASRVAATAQTERPGPAGSRALHPAGAPPSWPSERARRSAYSTPAQRQAEGVAAVVQGRVPDWLQGVYLRNGPGEFEGMNHLFDGYALLAKWEVDGPGNRVEASHRFLESRAYQHWSASDGRMRWREFGTPVPHDSLLSQAADVARTLAGGLGLGQGLTDNAGVSVLPQRGKVLALTETVVGTYVVDPGSLRTLHRLQYEDAVKGEGTTAHPSILPNEDIINLVSKAGKGFTVVRQSPVDPVHRQPLAFIPHRRRWAQSWVHDFPSSLDYTVLPETPAYYNLAAVVTGRSTEHVFLDWRPEDGALLHVVSHKTGQVKTFHTPAFLVMHWVNAFESEDGRYLHLDAAVYEGPALINDLYLEPLRAGPQEGREISRSCFRRLTLDLEAPEGSKVAASWEPLVGDESAYGHLCEMPAINPARRGQPYRFAWGLAGVRPTNFANSYVKFDTLERSCTLAPELGGLCGEPLFLPAPNASSEDQGVLLGTVVQPDGNSALVFLDGASMQELARAVLPYGLPMGFHGAFMPGLAMQ